LSLLDLRSDSRRVHPSCQDHPATGARSKIALAALLLLAPSPRSVGRNRPATKFLLFEPPPLTFARRDPAKSGLDFLALLASLRGHAVAAIGIVAMPVSGALGAG
jgi:hypothetical protein